jgi:hypothetical protein
MPFFLLVVTLWTVPVSGVAADDPGGGSGDDMVRALGSPPMPPSTRFRLPTEAGSLVPAPSVSAPVSSPDLPGRDARRGRTERRESSGRDDDGQRYFHREDEAGWTRISALLARTLSTERLNDLKAPSGVASADSLDDFLDYVDERLEAVLEADPYMSTETEDSWAARFARQYVEERVEAIALDETGALFMMPYGESPGEGRWLAVPLAFSLDDAVGGDSPASDGRTREFSDETRPASTSEASERRHRAVVEAWRP